MIVQKAEAYETNQVVTDQQLAAILESINSVRFGSVTLIIQDGKLVQIDKNEKTRLR